MNDDVKRMWKEAVVPYFEELSDLMYSKERKGTKYRVIHKSLRNFRTRLLNNQERQGRKEHINR